MLGTGAAAALLMGCGKYGDSNSSSASSPTAIASTSTSASASTSTSASASASANSDAIASASASSGRQLAKTSDIPLGGGKIFKAQKIVVTQPTKDEFKAFSAICTHQGCTVSTVADGTIDCPCHGSKYRITDASVVAGPAPRPLPAEKITVEGNSIHLG